MRLAHVLRGGQLNPRAHIALETLLLDLERVGPDRQGREDELPSFIGSSLPHCRRSLVRESDLRAGDHRTALILNDAVERGRSYLGPTRGGCANYENCDQKN